MSTDREKQRKTIPQDRQILGERLKDAREYIGFSQEEVATFIGTPRSALSLMETGQRKVEALELKKLANLYKRPLEFFTGQESQLSSFGSDIEHLARKVSKLTPDDRAELVRFADFLRDKKRSKEE